MKLKQKIWIPGLIGVVSAASILLVSKAEFVIPLGNNYSIGIGEILNTLSAALGGPIAAIITVLVTGIGHFVLNPDLYADPQFIFIALADACIHLVAMLVIVIIYSKVLYRQARQTGIFSLGWWLTIGVYYYLVLLPLQVALLNYADPAYGATYSSFAKIFLPEFFGTAAITNLVLFALPVRYRQSQWIDLKNAPRKRNNLINKRKEGAQ